MSQLQLLRDVWAHCSEEDRDQFRKLLEKDNGEQVSHEDEEVEEVVDLTPEPCALCLSELSEPVNPYVCVHEFCRKCYDTSKYMACMKMCPMCRESLRPPDIGGVAMFSNVLDIYIDAMRQYCASRTKLICKVSDILFYNVDILDQFRLISSDPVNFLDPTDRGHDGGIKWDSGIYTMTFTIQYPILTYIQRYMLVNRRSDNYIRYCILFETTDLAFNGKHLKVSDEREYFTSARGCRFCRTDWTKVSDINILNNQANHEEFLAKPSTTIANEEFPVGYTQLEDSILQKGTTLHIMIPLYISIAHDLLIYDKYNGNQYSTPYAFLACKSLLPPLTQSDSVAQRIFIKPIESEIPIHSILRTRID